MNWDTLNRAATIATLLGFPFAVLGIGIWPWLKSRGLHMSKWLRFTIIFVGLAAYGIDVYDRLFVDHSYPFALHKIGNLLFISDKSFYNDRVIIDGKSFNHCKFYNVTFVYNGTDRSEFINNEFIGSRLLASDNPAIDYAFLVMKGLGINADHQLNIPPGIDPPTIPSAETPQGPTQPDTPKEK